MNYRKIGRYGVKVSEIALGSWLTYGGSYGQEQADACVKKAYDLGINYFDTADVYGAGQTHPGAAEEVLAKSLEGFSRSSYVLATKTFWSVGDGPNDRGLSRKHIMEQCNASLKRLNTDYVDIFYCHRYDPETPIDEVMRALDDLIHQGKVLYAGVSEWSATQILDGQNTSDRFNLSPIVINQPAYNMLNRYIEKEVMSICTREGLGIAVFSPLAEGVLTGKYKKGQELPKGSRAADPKVGHFVERYLTEENFAKVERLSTIAVENKITMAQLALAWILHHKEISSVIIGASRPEQVEENVRAVDVVLDENTMEAIDEVLTK
ncbi:MAG: aldo/keto reductase family protein [Caldisericia bacterium]|jgi:voltage-dependent potassium channel beta subunit|nr:aldo/keto reductase [Coprothermobacter sp.]